MKRLMFLFGMLLGISNLNAQLNAGLQATFLGKPEICDISYVRLLDGSKATTNYLNKKTYSFFSEDKLYVLMYEDKKFTENEKIPIPKEKITRNIYLYRLDNDGWIIASNKPVQIDYYDSNSYAFYFPWRVEGDTIVDKNRFAPAENGSVSVSNGIVTIVLLNHKKDNFNIGTHPVFYNTKIVLAPNADGTYNVQ